MLHSVRPIIQIHQPPLKMRLSPQLTPSNPHHHPNVSSNRPRRPLRPPNRLARLHRRRPILVPRVHRPGTPRLRRPRHRQRQRVENHKSRPSPLFHLTSISHCPSTGGLRIVLRCVATACSDGESEDRFFVALRYWGRSSVQFRKLFG